jgi:cellulose synthase/poly-beta-1,6-N-acetylglucosamine synthase-like glycosyltransferase
MISVIIINYARPDNVGSIVSSLLSYDDIGQIIVQHCNSSLEYKPFDGATNTKFYQKDETNFGAASRFFAVEEAIYENILFLDDDLLPSNKFVSDLLQKVKEEPIGLYGPYPRYCGGRYIYNPKNYNVVLTGLAMTSKKVVQNYLQNFSVYKDFLVESRGNGEDLSFNHNLRTNLGVHPTCVGGEFTKLDETTIEGFSAYSKRRTHNHFRHRFCAKFS